MKTPVAFFIFNRPDCTRQVFDAIKKARPPMLLIVADGARKDREGEVELCRKTRMIIDEGIDWPCKILRNYADENLGCGKRVSSGLNWVFTQVEGAIILEDDCLPSPQFFIYAEELLERYKDDTRIGMIAGYRYHPRHIQYDYSYHFSSHCQIWGWATWARAWKHYDFEGKSWPLYRNTPGYRQTYVTKSAYLNLTNQIDDAFAGTLDTWDMQWIATCKMQGMLTIMPSSGLIQNIGWGPDATHSKKGGKYTNLEYEVMEFPLVHPPSISQTRKMDLITEKTIFTPTWISRFRAPLRMIKRLINKNSRS